MVVRQHHSALVVDFLARGGTIHKLPPAQPADASDIVEYLQDNNVNVHVVSEPECLEVEYVYNGEVVTLKKLVAKANRHRSRRRLPPFDLADVNASEFQ